MASDDARRKKILIGIAALAAPFVALVILLLTSSLFLPIIPLSAGIVAGIAGVRSGDKKVKTLSIIGLSLIACELVFGIPWIFLII